MNGGRWRPRSQTVAWISPLDSIVSTAAPYTGGFMAPSREDTKILVFATLLVVVAGLLIAAVLLIATRQGGSPKEYKPFPAGAVGSIRANLKDEGPYYVADPFGGDRSILFALEDGKVVALSNVVPNTKDCRVNIKNEGKSFVDCNGDRLKTTDLARYATEVEHIKGGNDILLVDLRRKEPPPSAATG